MDRIPKEPLTVFEAISFCFDLKENTKCDTTGQALLVLIAFSITILISALVLHLEMELNPKKQN